MPSEGSAIFNRADSSWKRPARKQQTITKVYCHTHSYNVCTDTFPYIRDQQSSTQLSKSEELISTDNLSGNSFVFKLINVIRKLCNRQQVLLESLFRYFELRTARQQLPESQCAYLFGTFLDCNMKCEVLISTMGRH